MPHDLWSRTYDTNGMTARLLTIIIIKMKTNCRNVRNMVVLLDVLAGREDGRNQSKTVRHLTFSKRGMRWISKSGKVRAGHV